MSRTSRQVPKLSALQDAQLPGSARSILQDEVAVLGICLLKGKVVRSLSRGRATGHALQVICVSMHPLLSAGRHSYTRPTMPSSCLSSRQPRGTSTSSCTLRQQTWQLCSTMGITLLSWASCKGTWWRCLALRKPVLPRLYPKSPGPPSPLI